MNLSDNQRVELIAFLKTLTDKEFLFNPKFGFPKK
jgi:cytochrome c peroxidase